MLSFYFTNYLLKEADDVMLKINISFSIYFLILLLYSISNFITRSYNNYLIPVLHLSIIFYFVFLVFIEVKFLLLLFFAGLIISYYFRRYSQLIFFMILTAVLMIIIFIHGHIVKEEKIYLLSFVVIYAIASFVYLSRNIKINQRLVFNDTLLNSVYEEISEGLVIADLNRNIIVKYNSKFAQIFDSGKDSKIAGRDGFRLLANFIEEYRLQENKETTAWVKQQKFISFSGKQFWGEVTITPLYIENRKFSVIRIRDISEKKLNEETIEKLSLALRKNPGIIIIFNSKGIIEYINQKYSDITGYSGFDPIGLNIMRLGLNLNESLKRIWIKIRSGDAWEGEARTYTVKGEQVIAKVLVTPMIGDKKLTEHFIVVAEDITRQRQAEKDAKKTKHKYETILNAIPDLMFVVNRNYEIVDYKEENYKGIFISRDKIIGTRINNIGMPENVTNIATDNIEKILNGVIKTAVFDFSLTLNDMEKYYESRIVGLDENEVLCIVRDITQKKLAEKEVKEARHKYESILKTVPDMMFVINRKGVFTDYKGDADELYVLPDKIIGVNIKEVGLPENLVNLTLQKIEKILAAGSKYEVYEYSLPYDNGEKYFEARMIALNEEEVLSIVRNITKKRIAEQKVIESEQNYRNLVEFSPIGILILKDNKVLYVNKTVIEMVGFTGTGFDADVTIMDFILPEDREMIQKRWASLKDGADVPYLQFKIKSPFSGKIIDVESKSSLIKYNNEYVMQIVFKDVSLQRKLVEEELRAKFAEETAEELKKEVQIRLKIEEKLKKSLLEKEILLKEVHHRVKNNMQVISSILNLQANTLKNKQVINMLEESQDRIKSMALIHETLYRTKDFSKIDFKEYVSNLINNLNASYSNTKKPVHYIFDLEKIFLTLDIAIPCGLIINELISNSLKHAFGKENKPQISVLLKKTGNEITLIIEDNGIGMDTNINLKDIPTLGLQLVYILTDQIDGKLLLESIKGTRFTIKFISIKV